MKRSGTLAVVLWLLVLAIAVGIDLRGRYSTDMSAFLPQRPSATQQLLVEQLRDGSVSRLLMIAIEGGTAAERAEVSKGFADRLQASGAFSSVQNGSAAALARDRELLFRYRYLLSPTVTEDRFTVPGLNSAVAESIDLLSSPAGMLIKSLLPRDPTGELLTILDELGAVDGPRSDHGVWASRDGQRALLMAQTLAPGSNLEAQAQTLARMRDDFAVVVGAAPLELKISGVPVFSLDAAHTIRAEVERLAIVSAIGIMSVLLFAYRSVAALLLGMLPVLSGVVVSIATVSIGFGEVHGLTIGFGTTLIGEAVDYSIYYFVQSRQAGDAAWRARFWPTIRLGVLTSLCGFATLLLSGFPGLAQLGLFSMSGLLVAATVTRFVLPSLRPRNFRIRDTTRLGQACKPWLARLARLRWLAIAFGLVALAIVFLHRDQLWNTRLSELSPMSATQLALHESLRNDLGSPDQGSLVIVTGRDRGAALQAAERVGAKLQALVDQGLIGGFQTPVRFLPPAATQRARQHALPPRHELARRLQEALRGLPLAADKLTPFLDDIEAARALPLLDEDVLKGTSMVLAVDAMLQKRGDTWAVFMPVHSLDVAAAVDAGAIQQAIAGDPDALFLDLGEESARLYADYLDEAIWLSLAGVLAIIVLLGVALRSSARLLRVLPPLAIAVVVVMAGLVLLGERLTLLHLVGLLLTVAVGSNYALFFNDDRAAHEAETLASVMVANLTTLIGFGALATASIPVLHAIGITVGPGAFLALLFSAMLSGSTTAQRVPERG